MKLKPPVTYFMASSQVRLSCPSLEEHIYRMRLCGFRGTPGYKDSWLLNLGHSRCVALFIISHLIPTVTFWNLQHMSTYSPSHPEQHVSLAPLKSVIHREEGDLVKPRGSENPPNTRVFESIRSQARVLNWALLSHPHTASGSTKELTKDTSRGCFCSISLFLAVKKPVLCEIYPMADPDGQMAP